MSNSEEASIDEVKVEVTEDKSLNETSKLNGQVPNEPEHNDSACQQGAVSKVAPASAGELGQRDAENCNTQSTVFLRPNTDVQKTPVSRRVSFPEDDRVVTGYMDPPNPWNDVSSCSTEELVNAYLKACEKFGTKPIPKLLSQLQAINDFCDRNETLTLKGERLDHKHCETIEEVLRRVQFRLVDIESTHLDEEGAVALFDMIEYYESAVKLNMSFNRQLGPRGWQACARMMKKTPSLEYLDARNCCLTEQTMPMLGRAIRLGSMLTTLHLENCNLSGRPLLILVAAIKMNEVLKELFLAENKLMPSDGIQLGNMLKFNHKLQLLDVRNNHLQDVGTSHLCDGLYEQNLGFGLNTLVLWNNQITYQSMPSLSRALTSTQSIETLNLGHNNLTNEGIHRLKEGLLLNRSLLRLGLQAAKLSCEGAVALAEFIADSPRLVRVDLRENDIKTGGLMALSLSLKVSESVTRVDIDKEPKKENGVKDYVDQQKRLHQDISSLMQRNRDLARRREEQEEQLRQEQEEREAKASIEEEKKEEEQPKPIEDTAVPVVTVSEHEAPNKKAEQLELSLPLVTGAQTLESPAFVPASALPVTAPQTSEKGGGADGENVQANQEVLIELPPSPMANAPRSRALLESIPEGDPNSLPAPAYALANALSPNTRRKLFRVSKVQENAPPANDMNHPFDPESCQPKPDQTISKPEEGVTKDSNANDGASHDVSDQRQEVSEYVCHIISEAVDIHNHAFPVARGSASEPTEINGNTEIAVTLSSLKVTDNLNSSGTVRPDVPSAGAGDVNNSSVSAGSKQCPAQPTSPAPNDTNPGDKSVAMPTLDHSSKTGIHGSSMLNGVTMDVSSMLKALDSRDKMDTTSESEETGPDEFEQELDAMLASVTSSLTTPTASRLTMSVEEILAEAAAQED